MAGNANSGRHKQRIWQDALNLEAKRIDDTTGQENIALAAKQLMLKALSGDVQALRELGDRLDGKPAQAIVGGDEDDNPISLLHKIERFIVDPNIKD